MKRIAIFSTYMPSDGFGGPARIFAERRALEEAGNLVSHIVIQGTPATESARAQDLVLFAERPFGEVVDHIYSDVDLGRRAAASDRLVQRVRAHLERNQIDLVILEQPFLYEVLAKAGPQLPMVYASQNIEYRLRRQLERFQYLPDRPITRADDVREIELQVATTATAVTSICPTDRVKLLEEFGVDSIVVPNGSAVSAATLPSRAIAPQQRYLAFAGSSYWPNVAGFAQMAQPSLAFLPPDTLIEVMGSTCDDLLDVPSMRRRYSVNASRIYRRGFVETSELVSVMAMSKGVLVPVFTGEGSNLKSADALASGAPVIMTERATHGYEDVLEIDPSGVVVTSDVGEFRQSMLNAIEAPWIPNVVGEKRREMLRWQTRLHPLIELVQGL